MTKTRVVHQATGSVGAVNFEAPKVHKTEGLVTRRVERYLALSAVDLRSRAERAIDRIFLPPAVRVDL